MYLLDHEIEFPLVEVCLSQPCGCVVGVALPLHDHPVCSSVWRLGDCDDGYGSGVACHMTTLSSLCIHMVIRWSSACVMVALCLAGFQLGCSICCERTLGRGWGVCVWLAKWDGHVTRMSHGNGNDCVFPFSGDMMGRPADMNMSKCA